MRRGCQARQAVPDNTCRRLATEESGQITRHRGQTDKTDQTHGACRLRQVLGRRRWRGGWGLLNDGFLFYGRRRHVGLYRFGLGPDFRLNRCGWYFYHRLRLVWRAAARATAGRTYQLLVSLRESGIPSLHSCVGPLNSSVAFFGSPVDSRLSLLGSSLLSSARFSRFMRCVIGSPLRPAHFLGVHRAALHWLRSTRLFQNWRRAANRRLHTNRRRRAADCRRRRRWRGAALVALIILSFKN